MQNKTTFRQGPNGQGRIADVVFFVKGGTLETIETGVDEDIVAALTREFIRRTSVPVKSYEKANPDRGSVVYSLHFVDGSQQDITVLI
jgi:hypothetical protein